MFSTSLFYASRAELLLVIQTYKKGLVNVSVYNKFSAFPHLVPLNGQVNDKG